MSNRERVEKDMLTLSTYNEKLADLIQFQEIHRDLITAYIGDPAEVIQALKPVERHTHIGVRQMAVTLSSTYGTSTTRRKEDN